MTETTALRIGAIVLDCPEPMALAEFYASVLGWQVDKEHADEDWVDVVDPAGGPSVSFQRAANYQAPTWPDPQRPQMLHLDVVAPDIAAEHERVVRLGAAPLTDQQGGYRVYADPAGHPFCICAS